MQAHQLGGEDRRCREISRRAGRTVIGRLPDSRNASIDSMLAQPDDLIHGEIFEARLLDAGDVPQIHAVLAQLR